MPSVEKAYASRKKDEMMINWIKIEFIATYSSPKVELKKTNRTPKINRTQLTSKSIKKIEELYAEDFELYHELLKR